MPRWTASFLALGSGIALVGIARHRHRRRAAGPTKPDGRTGSGGGTSSSETEPARDRAEMLGIVRHPVCWQGFFTHWVGLMHQATFTLLWGMPLMTLAMGSPAQAGGVLVVNTIAAVAGP